MEFKKLLDAQGWSITRPFNTTTQPPTLWAGFDFDRPDGSLPGGSEIPLNNKIKADGADGDDGNGDSDEFNGPTEDIRFTTTPLIGTLTL